MKNLRGLKCAVSFLRKMIAAYADEFERFKYIGSIYF